VAVGVGALLVFGVVTEDQVTTTVQAIAGVVAAPVAPAGGVACALRAMGAKRVANGATRSEVRR
jgi:hypothetical protein